MDDLEFRRTVLAEPNSDDPQVKAAGACDPVKQAFINDIRLLDDQIKLALDVKVPEHLAQRLILRQTIDSHVQARRRGKIHLALAASVAFAIGIAVQTFYSPLGNNDIGSYSLAHLEHELKQSIISKETNTFEQINAKLAHYGGKMDYPVGKPIFANYCNFEGVTSLHLVYEDANSNQFSVFITAKNEKFDFIENFANEHYFGKGFDYSKAQITVVSDNKQQLEDFSRELDKSLNWSI